MNLLNHLFPSKQPTASAIAQALSTASADLAKAKARAEASRAALSGIAVMSDLEHADAEAAAAEASRAVARLEARIAGLQDFLGLAEKAEADAAFNARVSATTRKAAAAGDLLDAYDKHAAKAADAVAAFAAVQDEVKGINEELRAKGLPLITTPERAFRSEADRVIPEDRRTVRKWFRWNPRAGADEEITTMIQRDGEMRPSDGLGNVYIDARAVEVEEVVSSERTIFGDSLLHLENAVALPPGRIGGKPHWPRGEG